MYKNIFSRMMMGLEYLFFRTGPLTMPPSTLGAITKSDESQKSANLEWHVQPLSLPKFGDDLHPFNAITPSVCNLRPTSRGYIRAKSSDPFEYPKIMCNYLSTKEDLDVAVSIPPALSAIGPKASIANCIAVVAIIEQAAIETP